MWSLALVACTPPPDSNGPLPIYEPDGAIFFDTPWPSDDRLDDDGTLDVTGFPNPHAVALLDAYLERAGAMTGSGNNSPIYLRFEGPLDPASMPTFEESRLEGSALVLVDIDGDSPFFGERFPVQWEQFDFVGSVYAPEHLLMVAPVHGWPLRPSTTYALIVTTRVARPHEPWAQGWNDREALADALFTLGLQRDDVAIATTFTTMDPVGELARMAWYVRHAIGEPDLSRPLEYLEDRLYYTAWRTHYLSPVFTHGEPPYLVTGGEFQFDAKGLPILARWDDLRLSVCTPKDQPTPTQGWPVVLFQHGTGGGYRDFCNSDGRFEVARRLGVDGFIGVGIDQPLHGTRPGAENASDLAHFNVVNPDSAVTNFRQGAIDALYLAHALAARSLPFETETGASFPTDPERIYFMGHSQGALTGALAAPFFGGDVKGAMLSGGGGVLAITVVERTDPLDFGLLVQNLINLEDGEPLTPLHPALGLVQTLVEITDPVNYAPYWFSQEGAFSDHVPVPVLVTSGTLDAASPYLSAIALGAAARTPLVGEPATRAEAIRLRTGDPRPLPLMNNAVDWTGHRHTSGFSQFLDGSHFVVFEEAAASDLVFNWFDTLAEGHAVLYDEDSDPTAPGSPGG